MPSLSEETTCFSASVYFNGEKLFVASNTGKGEGNRIDLVKGKTRVDLEAFRKELLSNLVFEPSNQAAT